MKTQLAAAVGVQIVCCGVALHVYCVVVLSRLFEKHDRIIPVATCRHDLSPSPGQSLSPCGSDNQPIIKVAHIVQSLKHADEPPLEPLT